MGLHVSSVAGTPGRLIVGVVLAGLVALVIALPASASGPTCSDFGAGWTNHGQHIVGDYVIGGGTEWPPAGSVGEAVGGSGSAIPGASGIHQHGGGIFQPGASFCNEQANSPTGNDLPRGRQ